MTPDIHVLLVSAQAAPNLLPALDPELKPKAAVLLVSRKMTQKAKALEAVLRGNGVKTSCVELEDEHDLKSLEETILRIATGHEGKSIALNVTGGTKLMALAAQSVALAAGWSVFYVDIDTDEIIWLDRSSAPRKIAATLRLAHYLQSYGFRLSEAPDRPSGNRRHDELFKTLIPQIGSLEKALGTLNYLAQQAQVQRSLSIALGNQQLDDPNLGALLRLFENADILKMSGSGAIFADEQALSFANGGWLEQYMFRTVSSLHGALGIRDKAANLTIEDDSGVKNELDVAFILNNRLFIIECKTARMDRPGSTKANDTLFKLAEISRRVGGLGTRAMLASYRRLGEAERRLAKALGIEAIGGQDLVNLEDRIRRWAKPDPR